MKYLIKETNKISPDKNKGLNDLLLEMGGTAFQGKSLGEALRIWERMINDKLVIFLGIAGALIPAGMRKIFIYLVENRLVDCIVSTGANLFHDCHESLGKEHWMGSSLVDDGDLFKHGIDRIYDVFAKESEFRETETFITDIALELGGEQAFGTREFLHYLGKRLAKEGKVPGILTSAAEYEVPIFCPAIADSSIGIALFDVRWKRNKNIKIDIIKDLAEIGEMVAKAGKTGVIYLAGGTPKNFIQQATLIPAKHQNQIFAHKYAIQITTDSPQWGGLSGCTLEEARSWGKISLDSNQVTVNADVTLAFPILVSAIAERLEERRRAGYRPVFSWKEELQIKYVKRGE